MMYINSAYSIDWTHLKASMEDLFQTALGISSPWYIESLKFDVETSRLEKD